jgi:hypothetical protein
MLNLVNGVCWLFILSAPLTQAAEPNAALLGRIDAAFEQHRDGWDCRPFRATGGMRPDNVQPRGRDYYSECTRGDGRISIGLFVGESPQDAARRLELSQLVLEVNRSRPMTDVGERGYEDQTGLGAWITFRQDVVFAQVSVGAKPNGSVGGRPSAQRHDEFLKAAKHFGLLIVQAAKAG